MKQKSRAAKPVEVRSSEGLGGTAGLLREFVLAIGMTLNRWQRSRTVLRKPMNDSGASHR